MKFDIKNHDTNEIVPLTRSVTAEHPEWVHDQMGSTQESILQRVLDQMSPLDYFDAQGRYIGRDPDGVGIEGLEKGEETNI